ncbi:ABC transporter permease [Parvicella tangerina]|uniref:Transport permease protein n=1 Tax=Parvicella tangerina TaxID=2829795 RepID=A0A916N9X7_9FLAO|nr:ABC transporter permease [Parvicella tangerina]CAG5078073.1 Teichoic acid translocation permease protein TagG [Parvicella tangerina]
MISEINSLIKKRDLVKYFASSELKSLYKNKMLGIGWAVLDPFFVMLVYVVLVSVIFQRGGPLFPVLLFSALLPWRWFTYSVNSSVKAFISNAQLIQTVRFPLSIFSLNAVIIGGVNYIMGLIVLFVMLGFYDVHFSPVMLWIIPLILIQFIFVFGVSMIVSVVGVFFPDLQNILNFVLRIGFYLSPALYVIADLPEQYQEAFVALNPFASLFENCKNILVNGVGPDLSILIYLAYGILFFTLGLLIIQKFGNRISKAL